MPRRSLNAAIGLTALAMLLCAPAASATTSAGADPDAPQIKVTGSAGNDQITMTVIPNPNAAADPDTPTLMRVQDPAGVAAGEACVAEGANAATCDVPGVVVVSGGAGDDSIVFTYTPGVPAYNFVRLFGEAGNDTIQASSDTEFLFGGPGDDRVDGGAGADYIECGDGTDGVVDDSDDLQVNECETSIRVGSGGGGGGGGPGGLAAAATIRGGKSAGTVKVSSTGLFTLKRQVVECPAGGARCKVRTSVTGRVSVSASKKRNVRLGNSSYSIAAGKKGAVRVKLTKKGLRLLRRAKKAKGTVTIRVTKGATVTTKKVTVTLRAPKKR